MWKCVGGHRYSKVQVQVAIASGTEKLEPAYGVPPGVWVPKLVPHLNPTGPLTW
jgi:hypothetical protein